MKAASLASGTLRWGSGLSLALALAFGCGQAQDGSGSNSNWLKSCASDSACDAGQSCRCGLCTPECTSDRQCSGLDAHATCSASASCVEGGARLSCALACTTDGDCARQPGLACDDGVCVKRATTGIDHCAAERATLSRYIEEHQACSVDSDCQATFSLCLDGAFDCTGSFFLNQSAEAAEFDARSSALATCAADPSRGPDTCKPVCSKLAPDAICGVNGRCEGNDPACSSARLDLAKELGAVVQSADTSCSTDQDCATVQLVADCFSSCAIVALAASAAPSFGAALQSVGQAACPAYRDAGCRDDPRTPCPNAIPSCVAGQCQIPSSTCDTRRAALTSATHAAIAAAPLTCATDSDCTLIGANTSCSDSCEAGPITTSGVHAIERGLDGVDRRLCPDYYASGCEFSVPACSPRLGAVCREGLCVEGL
jgi:hypothetical protein